MPTRRVTGRSFIVGLQQNGVPVRRLVVQEARVKELTGNEIVAPNAWFFAVDRKAAKKVVRLARLFGVRLCSANTSKKIERR